MKKQHTIWDSRINTDDWQDFLEEEGLLEAAAHEQYEAICRLNDQYLDDERANLDIATEEMILAIGDLGFWDSRKCGYKEIGRNISDCLYSTMSCPTENNWFVDELGDLRLIEGHHDGTNLILYREWKTGLSDTQKENFLEKLLSGKATRRDITRYTKKLGDRISKVYGWEE